MGKEQNAQHFYSKIKIGSRYLYRNLSHYYEEVSARFDYKQCRMLAERFSGKEYVDFVPLNNLDYIVYFCPVDLRHNRLDENVRAKQKIDFIIDSCSKRGFTFSLSEISNFENRKEMTMVAVIDYVLNFLLQSNQDIDLLLSSDSTSYLFNKLSKLFKAYLDINVSEKYIMSFIYREFSKDFLKFSTSDSCDKLVNVSECFVENDTLHLIFEMPRRI